MGLLTGYIGGRKARQEETTRDITNAASQYEFLEYLDNRKYRNLTKKSTASNSLINIDTAPSRLKKTRAENIADTATAENKTAAAASDLDTTIADNNRNANKAIMGLQSDQIDAASQIFGGSGSYTDEDISDEQYQLMMSQAQQTLGSEFLDSMGLDDRNNQKNRDIIKAIRQQSIQRVSTQISEYLTRLERQWDLELESAKVKGIDAKTYEGQLWQDRAKYAAEANYYPPGSLLQKQAQAAVESLDRRIRSNTQKQEEEADQSSTDNFNSFLKSTFPLFSSEVESSPGSSESVASSAFINTMYKYLNNIHAPERSREILATMYKYSDTVGFSDNKFIRRNDLEGLKLLGTQQYLVDSMDSLARDFAVQIALGKGGREIVMDVEQELAAEAAAARARMTNDPANSAAWQAHPLSQ